MSLLEKLNSLLDGRKTYIVALITGGLGIWISLGTTTNPHTIPEFVWVILGAAGLGSIRSAIGNGK